MNYVIFSLILIINIKKSWQKLNSEENSLEIIQRNWPALSDWICEEVYCSGLRIPKNIRHQSLWGTGSLEASDEDYQDLHAASLDSEPVDPFDNKDFILTSTSKLTSHLIRFGIHQYSSKKQSKTTTTTTGKPSKKQDGKKNSSKNTKQEKESNYKKTNIENNENLLNSTNKETTKKPKIWWFKFFKRQKLKKNQENEIVKPNFQKDNFEYLFFGSEVNNKTEYSLNNTNNLRKLYAHRPNDYMSSVYNENNNRPDSYVPLEIKTSIFAAYFASEPILIHFSKTIARNRRVRYGQEIGVAESFPRTINNAMSNIILSRCDGTISIINQVKGLPIQSTRMFLVITCNDTPV